jgi:hypothetical protein
MPSGCPANAGAAKAANATQEIIIRFIFSLLFESFVCLQRNSTSQQSSPPAFAVVLSFLKILVQPRSVVVGAMYRCYYRNTRIQVLLLRANRYEKQFRPLADILVVIYCRLARPLYPRTFDAAIEMSAKGQ